MKQLLQHIANKIGYTLAGFCNKILLKSEGVKQQGKITIYGKIRLKIKGELQFGDRVLIRSSWSSNPAGGGKRELFYVYAMDPDCLLEIM